MIPLREAVGQAWNQSLPKTWLLESCPDPVNASLRNRVVQYSCRSQHSQGQNSWRKWRWHQCKQWYELPTDAASLLSSVFHLNEFMSKKHEVCLLHLQNLKVSGHWGIFFSQFITYFIRTLMEFYHNATWVSIWPAGNSTKTSISRFQAKISAMISIPNRHIWIWIPNPVWGS